MPSRNLYKCQQAFYYYFCILFMLSLQCYCCLFTCLFLFYTDCCYIFVYSLPSVGMYVISLVDAKAVLHITCLFLLLFSHLKKIV